VAQPTRRPQLRSGLTGFAADLAARLERDDDSASTVRIITESQAVGPMWRILSRIGLETLQAFRQGDGRMTPTWYESPELWIMRWAGSDTAIVLRDDAQGPVSLRFLRRLASDTVATVYLLGVAATPSRSLLRAAWDLGLRVHTSEESRSMRRARRPEAEVALASVGFSITEEVRGDQVVRRLRLERRP
jgi:hypothetical protein